MTRLRIPLLLGALLGALLAAAPAARAEDASADTMTFEPYDGLPDSAGVEPGVSATVHLHASREGDWLRAPIGDDLLTHPDPWRSRHARGFSDSELTLDYNRVDLLRYGLRYQAQDPETMYPRFGARLEYATGRKRTLYGVQIEQPLLPTARFVLGFGMVRRTDHGELQQVDDVENSLALLFSREDWRDYFEREGFGAYLSWRVPDFSTVSAHLRSDQYRSLAASTHVTSWTHKERTLRPNPSIDDGEAHRALLRLERLAHHSRRTRAGLYHWIELERAGGSLGGDFEYTRALADLRSVLRLSPAVTLSLRAVGGGALDGRLPLQEQFALGGVDGLRAHAFGAYRGDHIALAQAEYTIGLWQLNARGIEGGLHAIVFADAGKAWDSGRAFDVGRQQLAVDGGVGFSTSEDDLRVTFAKDLQQPDSDFVVSLRLQRPF